MIHFWVIFVRGNKKWGWRAFGPDRDGAMDIVAYRTRKEAAADFRVARKIYGEARLYKFKPEAFIFGACK